MSPKKAVYKLYNRLRFHRFFSTASRAIPLAVVFLVLEFYDELSYIIGNTVLPSIRTDLALSYAQVGLLLGLPHLINTFIEPVLMLLGDTHLRKGLVVGGGLFVVISCLLVAGAWSFPVILVAFIVSNPAYGAFVSLSQATLMDLNPNREPHMMARWAVAGSLGNLIGPLILAGGFSLMLGWRWVFYVLAGAALLLTLLVLIKPFPLHKDFRSGNPEDSAENLKTFFQKLWRMARNPELIRWIGLQQSADLMMDIFIEFLPLYLVDVMKLSAAQVGLLLGAYILIALLSDIILIPLLERVPGRLVVRISSSAAAIIYVAWLLSPWLLVKVILLLSLSLAKIGWYPVLAGETYAVAPGRSGTIKALGSIGGLTAGGLRWLVGWVANLAGLPTAMWLLLLAPISLILFVPKPARRGPDLYKT